MAKRPPRWLEAARQRTGHQADAAARSGDWLTRALARAGVLTLPDAERAVAEKRVKVEGHLVAHPFTPVSVATRVTVDGREVSLAFCTRVLMFHKPAGLITHGSDPEGIGTVFEGLSRVLDSRLKNFGWHAVGRLDRGTTGLLLFTNDEKFVAHATQPQTHLPKRYLATVGSDVTSAQLERLRAGIELDDGPTRPSKALQRGPRLIELTLTEGRYHQVKRMLEAVGQPTLALHREAVGALECDVALGEYREVTAAEISTALGFSVRGV